MWPQKESSWERGRPVSSYCPVFCMSLRLNQAPVRKSHEKKLTSNYLSRFLRFPNHNVGLSRPSAIEHCFMGPYNGLIVERINFCALFAIHTSDFLAFLKLTD